MTELETANQRIAELEARVQELGKMARDVNSRRVVELEAELAAMRAGGELTKWRLQHHPDELPDGEVVDYPLQSGDFADGWTDQPLYTHPSPPEGMAGWMPIETAPKDGTSFLGHWQGGKYDCAIRAVKFYNGKWWEPNEDYLVREPTHWMPLPAPPLASEAKGAT